MKWAGKILLVIAKHDETTKSNRNYQEDKLMMEFLRNDTHQPTNKAGSRDAIASKK